MLTEKEVTRSWRQLFKTPEVTFEAVEKADSLLDELRPESPLRHRLQIELAELRQRAKQPV